MFERKPYAKPMVRSDYVEVRLRFDRPEQSPPLPQPALRGIDAPR